MSTEAPRAAAALLALGALALAGCRQDMHDQAKVEPLEASAFFADGRASRAPVPGTVARGHLDDDPVLATGLDAAGEPVAELPVPVTRELLERGRERFEIFCTPCHDRVGTGQGMIVRRGYKRPQSFHTERLRTMPVGYFFDVATRGFGQMPSYARQVPVADRWAIAAYIRVLQLSQSAPVQELSQADLDELAAADEQATAGGGHGGAGEEEPQGLDGEASPGEAGEAAAQTPQAGAAAGGRG